MQIVSQHFNNLSSPNAVTPSKMEINLGVTVYASLVNPSVGVTYFGIDALYPGGFYQFVGDASSTQSYIDSKYGVNDSWTHPRIIPWGLNNKANEKNKNNI